VLDFLGLALTFFIVDEGKFLKEAKIFRKIAALGGF